MCCYVNMETVQGAYARELVVFNEWYSWTHFSSVLGSLINSSYKLDIRTLITLLNVWVANDCETPKIYLRTLKEQPCAILYMVSANCRCSSIGLGTITIGSFIMPCSILHKIKLNVSLSLQRLSLNSLFVQVAYPSRQSFFCSSRSRFGIFCFFGRFWTVCKIPCVTIPTASSSSPPFAGKKTSASSKHSSSLLLLFFLS